VVGLKYEDALAALLQKPEGEFRLDVRRAGRALDIGFTPRPYRPIVVSSRLLSNGVAVIRIRRFDKGVAKQVARALEALASRPGGTLRGLVLDLRGNPGGITEEAGETGRLFLAGPFASVRGLHDETVLEGPASPRFGALEVVVLTDDETTSAAEVLAGSMQARGRAKIFGRTTAGKADSQVPMLLADGAFARMTVARTYLANGTTFADVGVKPDRKAEDIVQEFRATGRHPRDAVLRAAIEALTRSRPATHE
jgi:carboxyl-terminal processing protease